MKVRCRRVCCTPARSRTPAASSSCSEALLAWRRPDAAALTVAERSGLWCLSGAALSLAMRVSTVVPRPAQLSLWMAQSPANLGISIF